ncbi:unnamed protein product [Blepharisma stoltei]|uniref:Potassium channel domain-containing protein n=1 Tax=Blepharisma stoltei TaxID=1481888 RepID=A0AAU9ILX4_9CILI|nr:unnamed protein product [Blepharisma stoltei]
MAQSKNNKKAALSGNSNAIELKMMHVVDAFKEASSYKKKLTKSWFDHEPEDEEKIKKRYLHLQWSEVVITLCAFSGFIVGAIIADVDAGLNYNVDKEVGMPILYTLSTLSAFLLVFAIIYRSYSDLEWRKERFLYSRYDNLWSAGYVPILFIECLFNFFHPVWFLDEYTYEYDCKFTGQTINYSWNATLSVIQVGRVYHLFRLWVTWSHYTSPRAQRVCKMNGTYGNTEFFIKGIMKNSPWQFVSSILLIGIMMFSYSIRVFEHPTEGLNENQNFGDFNNAMWNVVITILTIGYGDTFPVTLPGRILEFFNAFYGILSTSLMIVTLTNMLELETGEFKAKNLLERLEFQKELKKEAAKVLQSAVVYRNLLKSKNSSRLEVKIQQGNIRRNIAGFQATRAKRKRIYGIDTAEHLIEKKVNYMQELTEGNKKEWAKSLESLKDIKSRVAEIYGNKQL